MKWLILCVISMIEIIGKEGKNVNLDSETRKSMNSSLAFFVESTLNMTDEEQSAVETIRDYINSTDSLKLRTRETLHCTRLVSFLKTILYTGNPQDKKWQAANVVFEMMKFKTNHLLYTTLLFNEEVHHPVPQNIM